MMTNMWMIKKLDGSIYGPVDTETVKKWIKENRISADDHLTVEGKEEWKPVDSILVSKEATFVQKQCSNCGKSMNDDAIICIECGFNKKTGLIMHMNADSVSGKPLSNKDEYIPDKSPILSFFIRSFTFPLRGAALAMVIFMPLIRILLGLIPIIGGWIYFGVFYASLIDIMRTAAGGPRYKVEWPDSSEISEMVKSALIVFFAGLIVVFIPLAATSILVGGTSVISKLSGPSLSFAGSSVAVGLVSIVCAIYFPMTLAIAGIYRLFVASINPVVLFRSISRIPREYALIVPFIWIVLALPAVINLGLLLIPFGRLLSPTVQFYFWAVAASRLGFMAYYNKEKLNWGV